MRGHAHRLLAGRRVSHEQNLLRLQEFLQLPDLFDQRRVDLLPPGRVENLHVADLRLGPFQTRGRGAADIFLLRRRRVNRHAHLPGQSRELLNRGRPMQIARDQERETSLFLEQSGELGRRSGLARAVESHQKNARRLFEIQRRRVTTQERRHLVVENLHHLLPGRHTAQHFLAQRFLLHPRDEPLRHLKIDIRLEQRETHLAQRIIDVRLRDRTMPAQVLKNILQLIA